MKKYLFSIICTLLPIFASAQEPYFVLTEDNTVLTFYYDDNRGSRGGQYIGPFGTESGPIDAPVQRPWGSNITTVVFDDSFANYSGLTSTKYWFYGCSNLSTITGIENLRTDNVTDMTVMFYNCYSLTSLNLSHFNTQNVTSMRLMFELCENLADLDVSSFDTSKVVDMHGLFHNCRSLTSLDISNFNTSNVVDIAQMFGSCKTLTSLDVSNFNTSKVTDISSMFDDCQSLTSIDVSGFNTANVTDMSGMFYNCKGFTNIDLSNFNTSNVTSMKDMFSGCSSLTALNLSGFKTSNVWSMVDMFYGCSHLTSLDITSFDTTNVTDLSSMFNGCSSLSILDISSFNTVNTINMSRLFRDCSSLSTIYVGTGWDTSSVKADFNGREYLFENCTSLVGGSGTLYDSDHTDYTYAHIDGGSSDPGYFTYSNGGSSGDYWQELESTLQYADDVYGRARDNSNVEQWMLEELSEFMNRGSDMLDAHEADEQEVRHMIEEINWICWEIEEAMNGGHEPSEGPEPYAIFIDNNTALEFRYDDQRSAYPDAMDIYPFSSTADRGWNSMAESIYSVVFDQSFANCTSLTSTEYWFFGCSNLETFIGLENLNTSNVTNMASMFHGCTSLTSLDLSSFNTSSVSSMKMMFS